MTRLPADPDLLDLTDTVVLVTGAGGGIGAGIALRFAAAGAAVAVHHRSGSAAAGELAGRITADGGRALTVRADITDEVEVAALIDRVVETFGRLDALVNNAGLQPVRPLPDITADQWRAVVETNLTGAFLTTQAAAAAMRATGTGGSITHIASIEGSHPAAAHAHYCSSKAALIMHARTACLEYGPFGIRVNTVSPGLIDREGLASDWPEGVHRFRRAAPLGRLGTAEDVGNACVFLASPMAAFVSGADLLVDGGVSTHPTW